MLIIIQVRTKTQFSYFSTKTYVVGTQKNRLNETVLLSTPKHMLKMMGKKKHVSTIVRWKFGVYLNLSYRIAKVSEFDQELPQLHIADQHMAPCGRATEHKVFDQQVSVVEGKEANKVGNTYNQVRIDCATLGFKKLRLRKISI